MPVLCDRCELVFENCFVPQENILGQEGKGMSFTGSVGVWTYVIFGFALLWVRLEGCNSQERRPTCCCGWWSRCLCDDVWPGLGEISPSSWASGTDAVMPGRGTSICASKGTVRDANWRIPAYPGAHLHALFFLVVFSIQKEDSRFYLAQVCRWGQSDTILTGYDWIRVWILSLNGYSYFKLVLFGHSTSSLADVYCTPVFLCTDGYTRLSCTG